MGNALGMAIRGLPLRTGRARGGASFDPLTTSPLAWYKADAGTNQTAGGSAAIADGDPVGQWLDQSGNGNHLLQATAGKRPTLKLNIINGRPVVRFDGVDDFLKAVAFTLNQPCRVVAVFSVSAGSRIWDGNADNSMILLNNTPGAGSVQMYAGVNGPSAAITSPVLVSCLYNGASSTISVNSGADSAPANVGAAPGSGLTLAASGTSGANNANPDYGEFFVYAPDLSAGNLASLKTYLKNRWGTP